MNVFLLIYVGSNTISLVSMGTEAQKSILSQTWFNESSPFGFFPVTLPLFHPLTVPIALS